MTFQANSSQHLYKAFANVLFKFELCKYLPLCAPTLECSNVEDDVILSSGIEPDSRPSGPIQVSELFFKLMIFGFIIIT